MNEVRTIPVATEDAGMRLDRWFRRHFPALPHARLEKLLRTGQVRVDGARAKANLRLAEGQAVRVPPIAEGEAQKPRPMLPRADDREAVARMTIYEDDEVLVLDKPPGLASQGGSGLTRHVDGLLQSLVDRKGERPRLVHRLDRETSGVLLVAKSRRVAASLSAAFRTRAVEKLYWGLSIGVPQPREGLVKLALKRIAVGGEDRMVPAEGEEEGQRAATRYAVLATAGKRAAFLALQPVTGRTHQLRAHCAALGTPLVGDGRYGAAKGALGPEIADLLHLHARSIRFPRTDGRRVEVTAPLPPHMRASWALLGFDPDERADPFAR
ncbi:MAG: RluA family pseudouridine synthase [Alphaproteobacteria bacterium]|nr:RluA family pseudouridine synthase [Alphaproteobacteria bacterium]